ncbi:non-ribosomal peptide synthetase [Micromonospora zamorensis]|uniref:Amino acid adenylation domain-containing protein n=1 Tax=Micromonospora zamorensis TaxID=709883 RepID=A0ABZ1PMN9_9ACTN|nr:non-ribosomal peptide synthetase [Micromonospora zamorensis]
MSIVPPAAPVAAAATHGPGTLSELIAWQATVTPTAIAVSSDTERLDYAGLDRRANQLGRYLAELGVGPESLVAVNLDRGVDLVVALLGVWRAGAAYLPLDPTHPAERRRWLLADSGTRVLLTRNALRDEATPGQVVCLDADRARIAACPDTAAVRSPDPDSVAYAIYTSGSTGQPKGVLITHSGIGNRVTWTIREHGLGPGDRVLQKTSVSFDAAGWEFFAPLASGGTVVLAPDGAHRDPAALVAAVIRHRITVLQGVPSVFGRLVDQPGWADCTSLRLVFSAGEPLHADLCRRLTVTPDVRVWNTYGPTECAIDVTAHPVGTAQPTGPVPIGRPLPNVRVQVLDADRRPVPVGVVGELYIGGANLGRGYLHRPDLTAERFVPDEYGPPGARLYRTGDQVRWRGDRSLEFVGRTDHQLKVNGVRIEPAEVEAVLAAHPDVQAAVVVGHTDPAGRPQIAAYVAGRRSLDPAALRAFCVGRLPEALVPAVFQPVAEFPLTASGKIDRSALPAIDPLDRPALRPPRTAAERTVAAIWRELLDVDQVGVDDDFYQLGGSSLVTLMLESRLSGAAGTVTLRDLLTHTTVAAQARLVEAATPADSPVLPVGRDRPLPLSAAQHRLWMLDQLDPGSKEWVVPVHVRLPATIHPDHVRAALHALEARHEPLRTRYLVVDGVARQQVVPPGAADLEVRDVSHGGLAELITAQLGRGFDLHTGPLWRAGLAIAAGRDHLLVLAVHHIASDASTAQVLERDLRELCAAAAQGRPADLAELRVQYADYAVWQQRHLTDDVVGRELAYWRETLAGMPQLELPLDHPRPARRDARGRMLGFTVAAEVAGVLTELGRRCAASPFMTLLTGFATVLARYTGQWDVPIGTPTSGHRPAELNQTAGIFLNPVVLRCTLDPASSFTQAVRDVRDRTVAALAHQDLPFDRVVYDLVGERDLSRTPLYQVALNYQEGGITGRVAEDPLTIDALRQASTVAKTDLTVHLWPQPDGSLAGAVEYATALFDEATVRRLADHFVRLLRAAADEPDARLDQLDPFSAKERHRLLHEWNGPTVPRPATTVVDLFEARRAATPQALALRHGHARTSYAELDDRANRFANHLRRSDVAPGTTIAVLLGRGPDLVAAILGCWKAGAACLPLDPSYPAERIGYLLDTAGVALAVTDSRYADRFGVPTLQVDTHRLMVSAEPPTAPARDLDPAQTAYVLFTSGSTGRPKGVLLSHAAVTNFLACAMETEALGDRGGRPAGGGAPLFSTIAFDLSISNLWGPLVAGQPVTLLPQEFDLTQLGALLLAAGPYDRFIMTPPHLELLAAQVDAAQAQRLAGQLWVAGGVLRRSVANQWLDLLGPGGLINSYGPTETTVIMSVYPVVAPQTSEIVPIGRPMANTVVRILDDAMRLLPVGAVGELYIGGACLATGYVGQPGLTAERFVPDPFGPPGARLYRSGDLGHWRPDGTMAFVGRVDDQVKVRGYRIEPGEISAVVAQHPRVRDCVVLAHQDRLVAFYHGEATDLAAYCARQLPDFMVPSLFVPVELIPLNANGKVDRDALRSRLDAALADGTADPTEFVAPQTVVEKRVAANWAELLGARIGATSDFFLLGGHSVLAARLIAGLQEEFDLDLPIRLVFEHPTVRAQAIAIEDLIRAEVDALDAADLTHDLSRSEESPA